MKLFVDDMRPAPKGWVLATDYWSALDQLDLYWDALEFVSLDHDISSWDTMRNRELTGYDLVCYMEQRTEGRFTPFAVQIHSQNPVGATRMASVLGAMFRKDYGRNGDGGDIRDSDFCVELSWFGEEYVELLKQESLRRCRQEEEEEELIRSVEEELKYPGGHKRRME